MSRAPGGGDFTGGDLTVEPEDHYRLPYDASPRRYELLLSPDLERARFTGSEVLELEVHGRLERIVMNAAALEIGAATLTPAGSDGWAAGGAGPGRALTLGIETDDELERVSFVPEHPISPGIYLLRCHFAGVLNDRLCGFYRSVFRDGDGVEHVIATTQFENTDARRAFPCFDEPDRKAVFSVTLDEPAGMLALSNGAEVGASALEGGGRRVRFADTILMSSYLVAFVVGPLEASDPVDAGGVAVRVVHSPGKGHLVGAALDAARHALDFFRDYFAQPYPGDKVDLVAVPDFAAGAMENLGCVIFREAVLLADPERAGRRELERLVEVVDHELAHMWFGDLVTMRWWNGIWLNEAFATFMALRCSDDYRPEWEVFVSFARGRAGALRVDALHSSRPIEYEVRRPDEVAAMFDVITYEKGAGILWMLEEYLGEERFRAGVRRYLAAHRLGNTETHDLWQAIEAESDGTPVRQLMDSWIFQAGHPLVSTSAVIAAGGGEVLELRQEPFSYLPSDEAARLGLIEGSAIGSGWLVPVVLASPGDSPAGSGPGGGARRILLGPDPERAEAAGEPLVVNAGGSGFYRTAYDEATRAQLLGRLESLTPLERFGLVSDTWATVLARRQPLATFFELLARLSHERDPHVWSSVLGALGTLDLVAPPALRPALAAYVRQLAAPTLARLGWQRNAGDVETAPLLRGILVGALGTIGEDEDVVARARRLAATDLGGGTPVDPDLTAPVLAVVAAHAGAQEYEAILDRWRHPRDPLDEVRHLYSLGQLRDPELAADLRLRCLDEVRTQNAPQLLGSLIANRAVGAATWELVRQRFDLLEQRFPANSLHNMLQGLSGLCELGEDGEPVHLAGVLQFYNERIHGGRRRLVAQSIEQLAVNLRLAEATRHELLPLLAAF